MLEIINKKPKKGFIYILKCNATGHYKIGSTKNISNRIKQLKTANSSIELIKTYPVENISVEKELHAVFENQNINREWFELDQDDLDSIDEFMKS
jgi:predicted GIY-YIG superfamily endonuclease